MRYASVCSGVGTCAMAWKPFGWETVWFAEIEDFPSKVLAHRFPEAPNHGDMLKVLDHALRRLRGDDPSTYIDLDLDVLAGGCPCQAFSVAGNRLSLEDARGNLTLAFVQLVHAIDALRPEGLPYVVYENVPGILSTTDNAFGCFLGGLAGEDAPLLPPDEVHPKRWRTDKKSGARVFSWPDAGLVVGPTRTVAWRVLDSQHFGLAQRRRRVVVVSCPAATGTRAAQLLFEPSGVPGDHPSRWRAWEDAPGAAGDRAAGCGVLAFGGNDTRGPIPVAAALNANRGAHNPGDFETGTLLVEPVPILEVTGRQSEGSRSARAGLGVGKSGDPMFTLGARHQHGVVVPVCVTGEITHALKADGADASEDGTGRGNPIVPVVYQCQGSNVGKLGTLVTGHNETNGVPFVVEPIVADLQQITSPGNRSNPQPGDPAGTISRKSDLIVAEAYRTNSKGEVMPQGDKVAALTTFTSPCAQVIHTQYRVRRLMPIECERLQGYPDNHTDVPISAKARAKDGPRYKAIGNGWSRNVFSWLGWRIAGQAASP